MNYLEIEDSGNEVQDLDWEQQWDEDVVAGLADDQLLDSTGLQLMPPGIQSVQLEDWDDWGGIPGQLPSGDPIDVSSLSGTGDLSLHRTSSHGPTSYRPGTNGRGKEIEEEARIKLFAGGLAENWANESIASPSAAGPPGLTDSPTGISLSRRAQPNKSGSAGGERSGPRAPTPEQQELGRFVEKWEAEFRPLDDYMTSNEITLVEVMRKRTDEWIRNNVGNAPPEDCRRKMAHLGRILEAVEERRNEAQARTKAVRALTDLLSSVQSLLKDSEAGSSRKAQLQEVKRMADRASEWLKGQVARQMEQPKFLDPFLLAKDIYARERELKQAAVAAVGTAKLTKETTGPNNHSRGDEKELLIPARTSPPSNARRNSGVRQQQQHGSAAVAGPSEAAPPPVVHKPGCAIM